MGSNGLFPCPYLHGERSPHWNPDAKGAFIGLTMKHTANDINMPSLEGVCMNMGLIHNIIKENVPDLPDQVIVSGGAANSPIVSQSHGGYLSTSPWRRPIFPRRPALSGRRSWQEYGIGLYPDIGMARQFMKNYQCDPSHSRECGKI